ncbi:MAG: peptidoglycan DD-metalloendopeptidase family protein [Candidatus Pacebacteria bacterium]|nr:peptidoglycan DD-metalloendopeptidase family protein [Candidatus Paceibacterota bacterium]
MQKNKLQLKTPTWLSELGEFFQFLRHYLKLRGYEWFSKFEQGKNLLVDVLYKKRGRYARPFLHLGMISLVFLMVTVGPVVLDNSDEEQQASSSPVLATATAYAPDFYTLQAEEVRQYRGGEIITHVVREGETISSIAERYGLTAETVLWANDLTAKSSIKPGQELDILPLDGVRHKVKRGETIYSVGKKYGLDGSQVQAIIDYPFNEFLNDETFELMAGQWLVVPDGVMPSPQQPAASRRISRVAYTPDAGSVTAIGSFVWPAAGRITQGYRFYHKAIDIANSGGGPILASDSGVVTLAGWPDGYGYGNRIIVDHGNGFVTLYAHLSVIQVRVGQRVNRGDVIGQMGNTGRSTGTHLHFEIRRGGALMNPLSYL